LFVRGGVQVADARNDEHAAPGLVGEDLGRGTYEAGHGVGFFRSADHEQVRVDGLGLPGDFPSGHADGLDYFDLFVGVAALVRQMPKVVQHVLSQRLVRDRVRGAVAHVQQNEGLGLEPTVDEIGHGRRIGGREVRGVQDPVKLGRSPEQPGLVDEYGQAADAQDVRVDTAQQSLPQEALGPPVQAQVVRPEIQGRVHEHGGRVTGTDVELCLEVHGGCLCGNFPEHGFGFLHVYVSGLGADVDEMNPSGTVAFQAGDRVQNFFPGLVEGYLDGGGFEQGGLRCEKKWYKASIVE